MTKSRSPKSPLNDTAPKRRGPPKGSANALRHGLTCGKLPRGCDYIMNRMNALRRQLEEACIAVKGAVSLNDAAAIQTAVKWERHGMLAQRWLRLEGDTLKPGDRLNFSREIAKASTERDKAIRELNLTAPPKNPWELDAESTEVEEE